MRQLRVLGDAIEVSRDCTQESGELERSGDPKEMAKALLSFFYGFIVQSALQGELDPKAITRGMKGLIASSGR